MPTIISGTNGVDNVAPDTVDNTDLKNSVPFRYSYTSAEQTITPAGLLTLAHGLATTPTLVQAQLICKTAELGYAVGDTVTIPPHAGGFSTNSYGCTLASTSTNIRVQYGSNNGTFLVVAANGSASGITNANWRLVVRAWA